MDAPAQVDGSRKELTGCSRRRRRRQSQRARAGTYDAVLAQRHAARRPWQRRILFRLTSCSSRTDEGSPRTEWTLTGHDSAQAVCESSKPKPRSLMRMRMGGRAVLVGQLTMFVGRSCVLPGFLVLTHRVVMPGLMMVVRGGVVVSGRQVMMLRHRMLRCLCH
jgi:hypothetical protein